MGGGFQFLDIILLGFLAFFLVMRLRNVLGKRNGSEDEHGHVDPFARRDEDGADRDEDNGNVIQLPNRSAEGATYDAPASFGEAPVEGSVAAGLLKIKMADGAFDDASFLQGARGAFEMILHAFAGGDRKALQSLLSPEVMSNFDAAIEAREDAGETLETTLVGFRKVDITEADLVDSTATVTVEFVSEQVSVTLNDEGDVVDGDENHLNVVTDLWTFERDVRSHNPNWILVETRVPD